MTSHVGRGGYIWGRWGWEKGLVGGGKTGGDPKEFDFGKTRRCTCTGKGRLNKTPCLETEENLADVRRYNAHQAATMRVTFQKCKNIVTKLEPWLLVMRPMQIHRWYRSDGVYAMSDANFIAADTLRVLYVGNFAQLKQRKGLQQWRSY